MKKVVHLTNEDHQHHPLEFKFVGTKPPTPTDDGGFEVEVPDETPELRVDCLICTVVLLPGEDYDVRTKEAWES